MIFRGVLPIFCSDFVVRLSVHQTGQHAVESTIHASPGLYVLGLEITYSLS